MFYSITMIYDAVLTAGAPCWHHGELKITEVKGHFKCFDIPSKKIILKDKTITEYLMVTSRDDTKTWSWATSLSAASGDKQRVVHVLSAFFLTFLVLLHERSGSETVSSFKTTHFNRLLKHSMCPFTSVVFSRFLASGGLSKELQLLWLHCSS